MKYRQRFIATLPFLIACGGAPFTTELLTAPDPAPVDSGTVDHDAGPGPDHEDAGAVDSSKETDASQAQDAWVRPDACSPLTGFTYACTLGAHTVEATAPGEVCVTGINDGVIAPAPTPTDCQCAETYNCACVLAAIEGPCGSGGIWAHPAETCTVGPSGGLTVSCK
jgi:hypothetical protein